MTDRQPVPLTARQATIAALYANGAQAGQVAYWFGISKETVISEIKKVKIKISEAGYNPRDVGTKVGLLSFLDDPDCLWEYNYERLPMHRLHRMAPRISQRRTAPPWGMDSSGTSASLAD